MCTHTQGGTEMKNAIRSVATGYRLACTKLAVCAQSHSTALLLVLGVGLLFGGMLDLSLAQGGGPTGSFSEAAYEDDLVRNSVGNIFKLIEGAFGALIMVVAGLTALWLLRLIAGDSTQKIVPSRTVWPL